VTFVLACVESFRDAYVRTGMSLVQSMIVGGVGVARLAWRALSNRGGGVRH
jgi:hypothetical protein